MKKSLFLLLFWGPVCWMPGRVLAQSCTPPVMNALSNQEVCNHPGGVAVSFSGARPGADYRWTITNQTTGLLLHGHGNLPGFLAANPGSQPLTDTVMVQPVAGPLAFVTNYQTNEVTVINMATNGVTATIPVGASPYGVAASGDGKWVYIANNTGNSVSVINTATLAVQATIRVGQSPYGMVLNPAGTTLYVSNSLSNTVSVINTVADSVTATLTVGTGPAGIAVSPDGSRIYVANKGSASVSVINTASNMVIATIEEPANSLPFGLMTSSDGSKLYVINNQDSAVAVYHTSDYSLAAAIPVGMGPQAAALSPDGTRLYVSNTTSGTISVINTSADTVTATMLYAGHPVGLSVSPDGSLLYVAETDRGLVGVYNTSFNSYIDTLQVGGIPVAFGNFISGSATCSGKEDTFLLTIRPALAAALVESQVICQDSLTKAVYFQDSAMGTRFSWTNDQPSIGLPASGRDSIPALHFVNQSDTTLTATFVVTSFYQDSSLVCQGNPSGFTITFNPAPKLIAPADQTYCAGGLTPMIPLHGQAGPVSSDWVSSNPAIGLPASGMDSTFPSFLAINNTGAALTDTILVTPYNFANGHSCPGRTVDFTITVLPAVPKPPISWNGSQFSTTSTGVSYQWLLADTAIGGATASTYKPLAVGYYALRVTDSLGCTATSDSFNLVVTGIAPVSADKRAHLLPNPSSWEVVIGFDQAPSGVLTFRLLGSNGQVMKTWRSADQTVPLSLSRYESGMYYLQISGRGYDQLQPLVIQK